MTAKKPNDLQAKTGGTDEEIDKAIKRLKRRIVSLHPDKHHGSFASKDDENKYYAVLSEVAELEALKSNQSSTELMNARPSALTKPSTLDLTIRREQSLREAETQFEHKTAELKRKIIWQPLFPKISLSALTAVIGFLWVFPNEVSTNTALAQIFNLKDPAQYARLSVLWLIILACTVYLWVHTYLENMLLGAVVPLVSSESNGAIIFESYIRGRLKRLNAAGMLAKGCYFTKGDLIVSTEMRQLVINTVKPNPSSFLAGYKRALVKKQLQGELSIIIADIIISRALAGQVIVVSPEKGMVTTYLVEPEWLKEVSVGWSDKDTAKLASSVPTR
jgi:hypothetical protein